MTKILIHIDTEKLCSIDLDPESILTEGDPDFLVAASFSGIRSDLPEIEISEQMTVGSLLDRVPEAGGDPLQFSISCGMTQNHEIFRGAEDSIVDTRIRLHDREARVNDTRLIDIMTEDQKHFLTRKPR